MKTIIHIAMLLLVYFSLYSAYRAGLAKLKYRFEHDSNQNFSYTNSTNTWVSMVVWMGCCLISLTVMSKIATP